MIKTLLITGIVTAILAVCVFAFLVVNLVLEDQSDEQIREFLNSTSVVEKFKNSAADKTDRNENRSSPLVQQAEAFANYLNPPKQKLSKNLTKGSNSKFPKPTLPPVTPKFPVLGTIVFPDNPALSQVLIDEPGKGRHWVRQSSKVGHLLIAQVKDGLVIVKGGEETFEIQIEKTMKETSLPKKGPPVSSTKGIRNSLKLKSTHLSKKEPRDLIGPDEDLIEDEDLMEDDKLTKPGKRSSEEEANLERLANKLQQLRSDDPNTDASKNEKAERLEKIISEYRASRVSTEEAKMLGYLGKKLRDVQKYPNQPLPIIKKLKTGQLKSKLSKKI